MQNRTTGLWPVLALSLAISGCTLPADAVIDYVFEGLYRATNGTVIELDGAEATVVANEAGGLPVGTVYMRRLDEGGELYGDGARMRDFAVSVRNMDGDMVSGVATFNEWGLHVDHTRMDYSYNTWSRIDEIPEPEPENPGSGGGAGDGDGTAGSTVLLYSKDLEGSEGSSRYFTVTVPSGASKLTVETFEENQYGYNVGDLFVSYGSRPTASHYPYKWTAQCASVASNRAPETCSFANPQAGTWHILLYGYHAYSGTSLKVTIDR